MSKFNLPLGNFKKVMTDGKSTTLRHKDGHEIKIAHGSLSPKMKSQLEALPHFDDGGQVQGADNDWQAAFNSGYNEHTMVGSNPQPSPTPVKKADGGTINSQIGYPFGGAPSPSPTPDKKYMGGSVGDKNAYARGGNINSGAASQNQTRQSNPKLEESKKQPPRPRYANGTPDMTVEAVDPNDASNQNATDPSSLPPGSVQTVVGGGPAQQAQAAAEDDSMPDADGQAALDNRQSPQDYDKQSVASNAAPAKEVPAQGSDRAPADSPQPPPQPENAQQATGQEAQKPALLPLDPDAAAQPADQQQEYQAIKNAHKSEFIKQNVLFQQDLANGHITPETYESLFDKKDTLGKIGMIFGLMVSGAGSGLTHQPNAMMQMMNNQITNDLEAQKQSKSNAKNLVSLMNQHEVQQAQAGALGATTQTSLYNLTRMKANNIALQDLVKKTARMNPNSPEGKAAQSTLGMLFNSVQSENYNLADRAASAEAFAKTMGLNGAAQGQGNETDFQQKTSLLKSGMLGPQGVERGKDMESKHVPGFSGQASQPVPDATRKELTGMVQYDQQLQRYTDWAKQHSGVLPTSPQNLAIINQGRTLAKALQATYRENQLNTVYRPGEQPLLSETIPDDPTKFLNKWRVIPQLNALRAENKAKLDIAGKTEGLGSYQGFGDQSPASNNSQPEYKTDKNGIKWMRGPDGKTAIRVQ